MYVTSLKK